MHLMHVMAIEVGSYINLWKILPVLILLPIWARLMTWMDKDSIEGHLPRLMLNVIAMLLAAVGVVMFVLLPTYIVAISGFVLCLVANLGVYLGMRHQKVGLGDLSKQFNHWIKNIGKGK